MKLLGTFLLNSEYLFAKSGNKYKQMFLSIKILPKKLIQTNKLQLSQPCLKTLRRKKYSSKNYFCYADCSFDNSAEFLSPIFQKILAESPKKT